MLKIDNCYVPINIKKKILRSKGNFEKIEWSWHNVNTSEEQNEYIKKSRKEIDWRRNKTSWWEW